MLLLEIDTANDILSGDQTLQASFIIDDRQTVDLFVDHQRRDLLHRRIFMGGDDVLGHQLIHFVGSDLIDLFFEFLAVESVKCRRTN